MLQVLINIGSLLTKFLFYYHFGDLFLKFLDLGDDVCFLECLFSVGGGEEEVGEGVVAVVDDHSVGLDSLLDIFLDILVYLESLVDFCDTLSSEGYFGLFAVMADVFEVADKLLASPWGNGRRREGGRGCFSESVGRYPLRVEELFFVG